MDMAVWKETDEDAKYGVVVCNVPKSETHILPLKIGDTVNIYCSCKDWFYGCNTRHRKVLGVFPKSFIQIKEAIVTKSGSYETIVPKELPIVQEITSVLREWGVIWKDLYMYGGNQEDFENIREMMLELIDFRRVIMSRKLTRDEMKVMQQKVTSKIDMGNARLGLDLVVRDEEGNILDPTETSTISLYRQAHLTLYNLWKQGINHHSHLVTEHQLATQRIIDEKESHMDRVGPQKTTSFNLYVNVKNFVCRVGEDADVLIALYDAKEGNFLSESYLMKWGNQGMPKDLDMLNNLRVVFTDMGTRDTTREKVFLLCQVIRVGRMDVKDADNRKQTRNVRRPFGVAAYDVTEILKSSICDVDEKPFFIPFMQCGERDFMENTIRKVTSTKEINHKGQGLYVQLRRLHGDLKQVQKEYPHLFTSNTAIARKIGFPDVIVQEDVRNDLYVTFTQGEFKKGNKTSDKNVEVTMVVCNQHGDDIPNVISEGAGGDMVSSYRSVVYYHEDKPKWFETIKVCIPIDDFYGSHLKFTFKHKSSNEAKDKVERPFAMAYIKLMKENGTTLSDNFHNLLVYKFDSKRQENPRVYLKLPSTYKELEKVSHPGIPLKQFPIQSPECSLVLNTNDSFMITTEVCSTKITHNVDLMGLLKWRENPSSLKHNLTAFMAVDGAEIVKFLQDTLDALFNILMQNSDSDLYDELVFDALIFLVGLISDRKFHQFRPKLDEYIQENYSATLAYNKLMVVLKHNVENAHDHKNHSSLLKTIKSLSYIFKFVIRSRILFAALNEGKGKQQFEISLRQVFGALNNLLADRGDTASFVNLQTAVLKHVPETIPEILKVLDSSEFSQDLVVFLNSAPRGKLTRQKLLCMVDIVHSNLFQLPESRRVLLPTMLESIQRLMEKRREQELCITLLSDVLDLLHGDSVGSTADDISSIIRDCLRTIVQSVIRMDRSSVLAGNCVAVMTAVLRQMHEFHYSEYILLFDTEIDLLDFLMEILLVFQDLMSKNVYPKDWNEMIMLQNSVFLKALRYFSNIIRERFTNPFEYQVWNNFFHCSITFLTQQSLQLENFSTVKRNKIISRYRDMRRETGFEIRSMWFNLGQHKYDFIPSLVGPVLEMTLIPEMELRKKTIPIFFDMMQCEFMSALQPGSKVIKKNFQTFEHALISRLDALVEGGKGDEQYKELFFEIMRVMFEGHPTMREQGLAFVEMIKELLQRLLEYRDVIHDENRENRMSCTVNLLNFYHDIGRQEMYVRYLHKLCDLHLECENFTEAAYTLMLYVKMLRWSDESLPIILQSKRYPAAKTHRELKEKLFYDVIDCLDKGKMWEKGIEMCKELAQQYEQETLDYIRLSEILQRQAECYTRIMNQVRPDPYYFRVGYYGLGFPSFIQNKVFIYRGKELERLSDFSSRLQNQFPNAQLLKTLAPPSDNVKNSPSQYLQINSVSPLMELKPQLANRKVHTQILKYYKVNEVQKFTYSRKRDETNNDVTELWLERTNLVTSYPFPGILQWFPVTSTHAFEVSPLENAVETLEAKNQHIKSLIDQHRSDSSLRVDSLSMQLQGVVDAAVNGGISNYKVFYSEEFSKDGSNPLNRDLVKRLRSITTMQLLLLDKGLELHRLKAPESLMPFQELMEERFQQMKDFVFKEYDIKITDSDRSLLKDVFSASPMPIKRSLAPPHRLSEPPPVLAPRSWASKTVSPLGGAVSKRFSKGEKDAPSITAPSTPTASTPTRSVSLFPGSGESPTKTYTHINSSFNSLQDALSTKSLGEKSRRNSDAGSRGSDSPRGSMGSLRSDRDSVVIELNQQLTPLRPKRPDADRRSRPLSGQLKMSKSLTVPPSPPPDIDAPPLPISAPPNALVPPVTSSEETNGDSADYEVPPPLPDKHQHSDYANLNPEGSPGRMRANSAMARMASPGRLREKEKPPPPLPTDAAPVIPPKRPNQRSTSHLQLDGMSISSPTRESSM